MNQNIELDIQIMNQIGLLQWQLPKLFAIDRTILKKGELGERNAKRKQVISNNIIFNVHIEGLLSLLFVDNGYNFVENEIMALNVLSVTEDAFKIYQ